MMTSKDAAKILYMSGRTYPEISKVIRVSVTTIGKWCRSGKWQEKKIHTELLSDNIVQRVIKMIDYQTKALERKYQSWESEDPSCTNLLERGDIDALQKLFTTIKRDARKFSDYVTVLSEFIQFLQSEDLDLSKDVVDYMDKWLNLKREQF